MMTNDEYRGFWERFLGRYPDFIPTKEQTEDWRRELRNKDPHLLEAAVSTVISEKSSNIPKLPWFLHAYRRIESERSRQTAHVCTKSHDEEYDAIKLERAAHVKQLQEADIDDLREATRHVLKQYKNQLTAPKDGDVETWSPWLRAAVWCNMYGYER